MNPFLVALGLLAPAFAAELSGALVFKADVGRGAKYTLLCVLKTRMGRCPVPA